jgi:DNA-binding MarR family transcriptional regulator
MNTEAFDFAVPIRAALNRKALADARHRAGVAKALALGEREMLAVQYLARAGALTPSRLGMQLQLSSGGTAAVIHRLERAGHLARRPHPRDGRSAIVRLTPAIETSATEVWAPLIAALDALAGELSEEERETVARFVEHAAHAVERHADRLVGDADARARESHAVPLPTLWA